MPPDDTKADRQRIQLILPVAQVEQIDELCRQLGHRSRGALLERLLDDLFPNADALEEEREEDEAGVEEELDGCRALVLVTEQAAELLTLDAGDGEPQFSDQPSLQLLARSPSRAAQAAP